MYSENGGRYNALGSQCDSLLVGSSVVADAAAAAATRQRYTTDESRGDVRRTSPTQCHHQERFSWPISLKKSLLMPVSPLKHRMEGMRALHNLHYSIQNDGFFKAFRGQS